MLKLKDLVALKKGDSPKKKETNMSVAKDSEEDRKQTYRQAGFKDSTDNNGDITALDVSLDSVYAQFQKEEGSNKVKQEELKEPHKEKISKNETLIKTTTVLLDNKKEKNELRKKRIEVLEYEITDIPNNPKKYGIPVEKGSSAKFWIGLFLVIPIAIYLFVFYISTSYSSFFKQFEPSAGFFDSVFDAQAFVKAWGHGALAGMFVTFIPFLFLGLGFLIHMFGEKKSKVNYRKITVLFIITFVFDSILAYLIEKKLYDITRTTDDPPFNINIAFQEASFWGIIFAGFVAYIIFGLVFDFVMKEYKERDNIKMAIGGRENKIKIEEKKIGENENEISPLKVEIVKCKGIIQECNDKINDIIIPKKEYKLYSSEYMLGWITSISKYSKKQEAKILNKECKEVYKQHIKDVKEDNNHQN